MTERFATPPLAELRKTIVAVLPEHAGSDLTMLNAGWDCVGVDADGAWIFKFPRHPEAGRRLRKEARILAMVRAHAQVPVPDLVLFEGPALFSRHRKLPGTFLETADYLPLTEIQRDAIAEQMAGLYAALHAIPHAEARAAGATGIDEWMLPAEVARSAPHLPPHLLPHLAPTLAAYAAELARQPLEQVYGYFDGHGWNMAFDTAAGVLNGVYDFADSGFGPRHQDLSYSNWISRDLTLRIIARYERMTGIGIDRDRVMLYSAMLRFIEYAGAAPDRDDVADRLAAIETWFAGRA